jgi:hypothetical protein
MLIYYITALRVSVSACIFNFNFGEKIDHRSSLLSVRTFTETNRLDKELFEASRVLLAASSHLYTLQRCHWTPPLPNFYSPLLLHLSAAKHQLCTSRRTLFSGSAHQSAWPQSLPVVKLQPTFLPHSTIDSAARISTRKPRIARKTHAGRSPFAPRSSLTAFRCSSATFAIFKSTPTLSASRIACPASFLAKSTENIGSSRM